MSFKTIDGGILTPIIQAAAKANPPEQGDYIKDDLLHCGKCNTPKQKTINVTGEPHTVSCLCECKDKQMKKEKEEWEKEQHRIHIQSLRANGLQDKSIFQMVFEKDDGKNPSDIDKAKRYVKAWKRLYRENVGLILWGNTGNGKTFTSGCIANALIDQGVTVLMTSFPRILGALNALRNEDRNDYIDSMNKYSLLIIDDLGAERESTYALEQVYSVIDSRYKAKKPLIITTNLTLGEMQKAKNMDYQRIYDRVFEMCTPLAYNGASRRKDVAKAKVDIVREVFG